MAVIGLEIEASEYSVCSVAGTRFSRSAQPKPCSQTIFPSRATATAIDGRLVSTIALLIRSRTGSNGSWAAAIRQTHATAAIQSASRRTVIREIIARLPRD